MTPNIYNIYINKILFKERTGVWGDGGDLVLELDEGSLKLLEAVSGKLVNSQPIHAIRNNTNHYLIIIYDIIQRKRK